MEGVFLVKTFILYIIEVVRINYLTDIIYYFCMGVSDSK